MSPQDKAPAYQWYVRDFMSDEAVALMSYEQQGIYRALLDRQWLEGSIPADPSQLAMLLRMPVSRFQKLWPAIASKFSDLEGHAGRLANARMERQRSEQSAFHRMKQAAGQRGGLAKANKDLRRLRIETARAIATHTKEEWLEMVAFFESRCVRCREKAAVVQDHIVPLYQGGHDGIGNIQPLCNRCNVKKGPESIDWRLQWPEQVPSKWLAQSQQEVSSGVAETKPSSASSPTPTKKKKDIARDKPAPDPRVSALMRFFNALHVEKFGTPAAIKGAKDGGIIKALLQQREEGDIASLMRSFFASSDPFIRQAGYTVGVFQSQIGKLLAQSGPRPVPVVPFEESELHQQMYKNNARYRADYDAKQQAS